MRDKIRAAIAANDIGPDGLGGDLTSDEIDGLTDAVLAALSAPPAEDETRAAAWSAGYEAGAEDQANAAGHRYTLTNKPSMDVTPNPYGTVTPPADDVREAAAKSTSMLGPDESMQHGYANAVSQMPGCEMTSGEAMRTFATWLAEHDERVRSELPATPPADDVRGALAEVNYCPEHGDLLAYGLRERDMRSVRCSEAHTIAEIRASVRPHGTVTDTAEKDRLISDYHDRAVRAEATAQEALTRAKALADWRATVTETEVRTVRDALSQRFHGLTYRERLIVRAALEGAKAPHS